MYLVSLVIYDKILIAKKPIIIPRYALSNWFCSRCLSISVSTVSDFIVSVWNSLPDSVLSAESVNSFKSRLDKFWSMHDFIYDYRASQLAAGS